ncbi:MAG: FHA domain-containing protein [Verrucomicrobiales bacterium]
MARLLFQLGDGKTLDFDLSAAVVTLGRSTSNDIVINNGWISSRHAKFERSGGAIEVMSLGTLHGIPLKEFKRVGGVYTVVDLDSHNGVMVNGKRVASQPLKSGDRLTFGQLEAIFEESPEPASSLPGAVPGAAAAESGPGRTAADSVSAGDAGGPRRLAPDVPFIAPLPARPGTQRLVKPGLAVPAPSVVPPPPPPAPPAAQPGVTPAPSPSSRPPAAPPLVPPADGPCRPLFVTPRTGGSGESDFEPVPIQAAQNGNGPPRPELATMAEETGQDLGGGGVGAGAATLKAALASLHNDVAVLEQTLSGLQDRAKPESPDDLAWARGLIQRIDLLEDLMVAGERSMPGFAQRLEPLRASLLQLLSDHGFERYTMPTGQVLDVAMRRRITIVEAASEGEGITEIGEVFRPGYQRAGAVGESAATILRKAEVRTVRRVAGHA